MNDPIEAIVEIGGERFFIWGRELPTTVSYGKKDYNITENDLKVFKAWIKYKEKNDGR